MQTLESNLQFRSLNQNNLPVMIVLHHAAAKNCTVEDIHRWHLERGWSGIGYHYFVRKDGGVYKGRPEDCEGAHCLGANDKSIGICFEGDFMTETMEKKQMLAGVELTLDIMNRRGIRQLYVHKELGSTDCPGDNFPIWEMKNLAFNTISNQNIERLLNEMDGKQLQRWLNLNGFTDKNGSKLVEDGQVGPLTRSAVEKAKEVLAFILK